MALAMRRLELCLVLFAGVSSALAQQAATFNGQHIGRVQDWTVRHLVFSGGLQGADLAAATKAEPRILFHLAERNLDGRLAAAAPSNPPAKKKRTESGLERQPWRWNCACEHVSGKIQFRRCRIAGLCP